MVNMNSAVGFAIIVGIVIIAVIIYTIIKVRKQAREAELSKKKSEDNYSAKQQNETADPSSHKNKENN